MYFILDEVGAVVEEVCVGLEVDREVAFDPHLQQVDCARLHFGWSVGVRTKTHAGCHQLVAEEAEEVFGGSEVAEGIEELVDVALG